jgi:hypothetical protein
MSSFLDKLLLRLFRKLFFFKLSFFSLPLSILLIDYLMEIFPSVFLRESKVLAEPGPSYIIGTILARI